MKNKFLITILLSLISNSLFAENVSIKSKNIILDKNNETSIFERDVKIVTKDGKRIKSQFAEYNKKNGLIKLEKDIKVIDKENNETKSINPVKDNKSQPEIKALIPLPPKPKYSYLRKWLLRK